MEYNSEDDGEVSEEVRRHPADPTFLDFATWKQHVGGLVRNESHVLLETDKQLREAIAQAMFLETASENLLKKRQKQIDLLDDFRAKEGETAKQLFSEVRSVLQKNLGPVFEHMERDVTLQIAKSKTPITMPLDTSRPPPRPFHDLPPLHIPPPPFAMHRPTPTPPSRFANRIPPFSTPPKPRLSMDAFPEFATTLKPPALMAQHLLPPRIKNDENSAVKEDPPTPANRDDSWRKPYHPTPLPPPAPFRFDSPTRLAVPQFRKRAYSRTVDEMRSSFPPLPPPTLSSSSPPSRGRVGINVTGIIMGAPRMSRRNSTSSSSGGEGAPVIVSN